MIITKKQYYCIKIADIIALGFDLIVKYQLDPDDTLKTIPILRKHLSGFLENNLGENIIDLMKYYLSTEKNITILKIMRHTHSNFRSEDFEIRELTRRIYGNTTLLYVNVYNKKTGVVFEDWVRPFQIKSMKILNELICWESEGEEIDFSWLKRFCK